MIADLSLISDDHKECDYCKQSVETWINIVPLGDLCLNCAPTTMRILLQDIIGYYNNSHSINLLDIMFHGNPKKETKINKK